MKATVSKRCARCGKTINFDVELDEWQKWASGKYKIQDAFPALSADYREMLLSGICPSCFNHMFSDEALESEPTDDELGWKWEPEEYDGTLDAK